MAFVIVAEKEFDGAPDYASSRPGIIERLGVALNSSDLSPDSSPVDLIGALGYVQINPEGEWHDEQALARVDPRTELGSVLLRLKIAGDRTLGDRAVYLLVRWVRDQRYFGRWKLRRGSIIVPFVTQGIAEWLFPVCPICDGRQVLGMDRGEVIERRIKCRSCRGVGFLRRKVIFQCAACRGFGWAQKRRVSTTKPSLCQACLGSGVRRRNLDAERMRALGLDLNVYTKHWIKRFAWLSAAFDRIDRLERNCLHLQMRV